MALVIDGKFLAQIPLFESLTPAQCEKIAGEVELREFAPGDIVLWQGQTSQDLWILLEGACEVLKQLPGTDANAEPILLAALAPYSNFGEMSFFEPAAHSASVRAKTAVKLVHLTRERFDELVHDDPSIACKLSFHTISSLAGRLRHMDDWVVELLMRPTLEKRVPEWGELRRKVFDGWKL